MSEKIFSWLLRLYPSRFRETYHEEALQLFRDRAREERGLVLRLRLWLDLILDLAVSLPREYFRPKPQVVAVSASRSPDNIPEFALLKTESPHPKVFFAGAVLSLVVLFGSAMAIRNSELFTGTPSSAGHSGLFDFDGEASPSAASSPGNRAPVSDANLSETERQQVIGTIAGDLKKYYVYPEAGQRMADALLVREKHGDYDRITDGKTFARLLTDQMREVSRDLHLSVRYSAAELPAHSERPTAAELAQYPYRHGTV
jgi:N-terminal domain of Peptidase_S41 in eukaryotic IRBP